MMCEHGLEDSCEVCDVPLNVWPLLPGELSAVLRKIAADLQELAIGGFSPVLGPDGAVLFLDRQTGEHVTKRMAWRLMRERAK